MKIYLLVFIAVCMLAGCAAPMRFENVSSPNTLEQDRFDCDAALRVAGFGSGNASQDLAYVAVRYRGDLQRCLERKGWRQVAD